MKIRDELKQIGFSDADIDRYVYQAYEREKNEAMQLRNNLIEQLSMSPIEKKIERLMRRLAWKLYVKGQNSTIPEFTGDRNNAIEVFEYNQRYGIMPIETIENEDGTYTHIYEDGFAVVVKTNLIGISSPSEEELRKIKIDERRLLAEILDIEEQYAINISDEKIRKLVLRKERSLKKSYKKISKSFLLCNHNNNY